MIHLNTDPKCVEALLTQLSARLASGHNDDKYVEIKKRGDFQNRFTSEINLCSSNWVFNLVLFDAAPYKRRTPKGHDVDKEKYESLL